MRPVRKPLFWCVYAVALTASMSFAVYAGVRYFRGPAPDPGAERFFDTWRRSPNSIGPEAPEPERGPGEMTDNPLAGVAMKSLDEDPDQIAPPNGAKRRSAFVRRAKGEVEMMARYVWSGSPDQAEEYYRKYLAERGMTFQGRRIIAPPEPSTRPVSARTVRPRRIVVFHGPKGYVTVTLRKASNEAGMLSIVLSLSYPES